MLSRDAKYHKVANLFLSFTYLKTITLIFCWMKLFLIGRSKYDKIDDDDRKDDEKQSHIFSKICLALRDCFEKEYNGWLQSNFSNLEIFTVDDI